MKEHTLSIRPWALPITAALVICLSGCVGGGIEAGDLVTTTVSVQDAQTGETLVENATLMFEVGSGDSGLGMAFEEAVQGLTENATSTVDLDALRWSDETQEVDGTFGPSPLEGQIGRAQFEGAFGPAEVGQEFTPPGSYFPYRVEEVTDGNVTFRALPEDGQRDPAPEVGSVLVTYVDETNDTMTQQLEPVPGATFTIAPPSQFQPSTPLGLEPGSYRVEDDEVGRLVLAYHASPFADAIGKPLLVEVAVDAIEVPGNEDGPQATTSPGLPAPQG